MIIIDRHGGEGKCVEAALRKPDLREIVTMASMAIV
jgi:hypothetical protein